MRKIFFLLFLSVQGVCVGNFHTLKPKWQISRVEVMTDTLDSVRDEKEEPAMMQTPPVRTGQKQKADSLSQVYLDKYYSVALPLPSLYISSRYGLRRDPFNHARTARHNGLDLKAAEGTCVRAMFAGKVIRVHSDPVSGNYVSIQHGDYVISFCHLSQQLVRVGDFVQAGDTVGLSGNTGRSTGPHLHITCRRKGKYVNPVILLEYIIDVRTRALEALNRLLG